MSVAANIAHSYVPPAGAPSSWRPQDGAVVGAVFWPVALFIAVEILARTAWPAGRRWVATRYAGLLPVAVVAAVVSYRHLTGLLTFYREDPLTARIGPLAVDGLMVMASAALIAAGRRATPVAVRVSAGAPDAGVPAAPSAPPARSAVRRTGSPLSRRTGTPAPRRSRTGVRPDAELIAVLASVPREADGTVPVRRAAAALACGPDRARRLLAAEGLLRVASDTSTGTSVTPVAA